MRVLAAFLIALPLFAKPLELPRPNEKWISLRVAEFELVSNASPRKTVDIARDLLRMQDAVGQVTRLTVRSKVPTKVLIFANERSFAPYRDAVWGRKTENTTGIFLSGEDGNFILLRADLEEIDQTVYHELTHYFVRNTAADLPLWFNEGFAEYYSTFKISGDDVQIGRPVVDHVHWLRNEPLIPLRELFATDRESPAYNEGSRRGVFYAESWALVHYLMSGDVDRRSALTRFLNVLRGGGDVDRGFSEAFGLTYQKLEQELRGYVRGRTFKYTVFSLEDLEVREVPEPAPMTRDAVLYAFGHMFARSSETAAIAERFLGEALVANPNHAGALAAVGRLHALAGRQAEADRAFAKAASIGSSDAEVYLAHGISILNRLAAGGRPTDADLLKARAAFQRATELDPESAQAWAGLGATYINSTTERSAGISALEKSLQLDPQEENAAFYLVQFYADAGRRDDAQRLVDRVLVRNGDRGILEQARNALLLAEVRRMESLARDGKAAEARQLASSILQSASEPRLREHVQSIVSELDRIDAEKATIDAMNRAVQKASSGKYSEALSILDDVLPRITDPETLERAKKFRQELAAWTKKNKSRS